MNDQDKLSIWDIAEQLRIATSVAKVVPSISLQRCNEVMEDLRNKASKRSSYETKLIKMLVTPEALTRVEKIFDWLKCLDDTECRLVLQRAGRVSWKVICKEINLSRTTAWYVWVMAIRKMADAVLNCRKICEQQ